LFLLLEGFGFAPCAFLFPFRLIFLNAWVGLVLPLVFSGPCLSAVWFGFSRPVASPARQILLFGFVLGSQIDFCSRSGLRSWFPRFSQRSRPRFEQLLP
jgi:hypothetical protein